MFRSTRTWSNRLQVIRIPRSKQRSLGCGVSFWISVCWIYGIRKNLQSAITSIQYTSRRWYNFHLSQCLQRSRMMLLIWRYLDSCGRVVVSCDNPISTFYHILPFKDKLSTTCHLCGQADAQSGSLGNIWMFPKIGGKPPKWMAKISWKTLWTNGWFGGFSPYVWFNTHFLQRFFVKNPFTFFAPWGSWELETL